MAIGITSLIHRKDELPSCQIDDEVVLLDINDGIYLGMNAIASSIWTLLKTPHSLAELCQKLMIDYDVSQQQCEQEVFSFLKQLENRDLIEVTSKNDCQ